MRGKSTTPTTFSYKKDIAFVKDEINDDIKMAIKEQSIGSFGEYLKTRN